MEKNSVKVKKEEKEKRLSIYNSVTSNIRARDEGKIKQEHVCADMLKERLQREGTSCTGMSARRRAGAALRMVAGRGAEQEFRRLQGFFLIVLEAGKAKLEVPAD